MYEEYKKSKYWKIINESMEDMKNNNDVELLTRTEYVVWYLVKKLEENNK